jgi:hypothetical protein
VSTQNPAVAADTALQAATAAATGRDAFDALPPELRLPAYRLIYLLPYLIGRQGLATAARVFSHWLFGEVEPPYPVPPRARGDGPTRAPADYVLDRPAYGVSWSAIEASATLQDTVQALRLGLPAGLRRQIEVHVVAPPSAPSDKPGPLDRAALARWKDLGERLRKSQKSTRSDIAQFPLPPLPIHLLRDQVAPVLQGRAVPTMSNGPLILGACTVYPMVTGSAESVVAVQKRSYRVTVHTVASEIVDPFDFDDRNLSVLRELLLRTATTGAPNAIPYVPPGDPARQATQALGGFTPSGHLAVPGTETWRTEPVVELTNSAFADFRRLVAPKLSDVSRSRGKPPLICRDFYLMTRSHAVALAPPVVAESN